MLSESCKLVLNLTNHTPREKDTVVPDLETDEEGKGGKNEQRWGVMSRKLVGTSVTTE